MQRQRVFVFRVLCALLAFATSLAPATAQIKIDGETQASTVEQYPVLSPDGNTLYFVRPAHPENKGPQDAADIWVRTRRADGTWSYAINPGTPLNTFAAERVLAVNPDGTRLAVFREPQGGSIELLERSGRNWQSSATWPLPPAARNYRDLTFNPNTQELIYSAAPDGTQRDLFRVRALNDGTWGEARPLATVNSIGDETNPVLAADNRTLYFQRNAREWLKADGLTAAPRPVPIETGLRSFAFPLGPDLEQRPAAVVYDGATQGLRNYRLPAAARPLPGEVIQAYLPEALPLDETVAEVAISTGQRLNVRPYPNQQFVLYLRSGEALSNTDLSAALPENAPVAGGLAATGTVATTDDAAGRLRRRIARQEQRVYDLRRELDAEQEAVADSLPPYYRSRSETDRLQESRTELERMKAKFRRQQDDRLHQRGYRADTPATTTAPADRYNPNQVRARGVEPSTYATPTPAYPQPYDPDAARRAYEDSLRTADRVRNDLAPGGYRSPYGDQPWERDVQRGIPAPNNQPAPNYPPRYDVNAARAKSGYPTMRTDEYDRQAAELERLRAELRRLEGRDAANHSGTYPARNAPVTDGQYNYPASDPYRTPQTYDRPAPVQRSTNPYPSTGYPPQGRENTYAPDRSAPNPYGNPARPSRATENPGFPSGITFIPNTAYLDGQGYGSLDNLVNDLKNRTSPLEVRVLTAVGLAPRNAQLLSEERATTIRDYLNKAGIDARKVQVIGYGNHLTGEAGERVEIHLVR